MNVQIILMVLLVVVFFVVWFKIRRSYKLPKISALTLITGGVKCGKSTFAVAVAIREHRRAVRRVKFRNFIRRLIGRNNFDPVPLLYSNIPLNVPYVPITSDLLLRKSRFEYGSIIYVNEASLLADSQLIRNVKLNTDLLLFNKLIGHETKGGKLIYDTQSVSDVHYSIKRSLSEYFYIHHLRRGLFFLVAYVIENRYSDDGSVVSISDGDVEDQKMRKVLLSKKYWKYFDCYCFSAMTDHLPVERDTVVADSLKCDHVLSFRPEINNLGGINESKE